MPPPGALWVPIPRMSLVPVFTRLRLLACARGISGWYKAAAEPRRRCRAEWLYAQNAYRRFCMYSVGMAHLTSRLMLRLSPELLADMDRVRGDLPRGVWIRRLCRDAVTASDALRPAAPIPGQLEVPLGDGTPVGELASRRQRVCLLADRAA